MEKKAFLHEIFGTLWTSLKFIINIYVCKI